MTPHEAYGIASSLLFKMAGVTIGGVSAMINAAIALGRIIMQFKCFDTNHACPVQLTLPLATVLIVVGLLKNRESAATW